MDTSKTVISFIKREIYDLSFSFIFATLIVGSLYFGYILGKERSHSQLLPKAYNQICQLIQNNYFENSQEIEGLISECFRRSKSFPTDATLALFVRDVEGLLSKISVSHLSLWEPSAMRSQWLGAVEENGIRARLVNGHWMIYRLVDESPAHRAGLSIGDEVLAIDGKYPESSSQIKDSRGVFTIFRTDGGQEVSDTYNVQIDIESLVLDQRPVVEEVVPGLGLLTIHSFVGIYFDQNDWLKILEDIYNFDSLIIDIRGNSGGNFVAMLRALSPFFCETQWVGDLVKPRKLGLPSETLKDTLDGNYQNDLIDRVSNIRLETFSDYGCFDGPVVVLMDSDSASVSEIFADAISLRPRTQVWGDFTSGQVVQAVWHPLILGSGFAISIPDALYKNPAGESLEGIGVRPDKVLTYNLTDAQNGLDSWVIAAQKLLKQ